MHVNVMHVNQVNLWFWLVPPNFCSFFLFFSILNRYVISQTKERKKNTNRRLSMVSNNNVVLHVRGLKLPSAPEKQWSGTCEQFTASASAFFCCCLVGDFFFHISLALEIKMHYDHHHRNPCERWKTSHIEMSSETFSLTILFFFLLCQLGRKKNCLQKARRITLHRRCACISTDKRCREKNNAHIRKKNNRQGMNEKKNESTHISKSAVSRM